MNRKEYENRYSVPADWEPVYDYKWVSGDFIGDRRISHKLLLGWLKPNSEGFISPDKLPDNYRIKTDELKTSSLTSHEKVKAHWTEKEKELFLNDDYVLDKLKTAAGLKEFTDILNEVVDYRKQVWK